LSSRFVCAKRPRWNPKGSTRHTGKSRRNRRARLLSFSRSSGVSWFAPIERLLPNLALAIARVGIPRDKQGEGDEDDQERNHRNRLGRVTVAAGYLCFTGSQLVFLSRNALALSTTNHSRGSGQAAAIFRSIATPERASTRSRPRAGCSRG
jgi:hypothetical protein